MKSIKSNSTNQPKVWPFNRKKRLEAVREHNYKISVDSVASTLLELPEELRNQIHALIPEPERSHIAESLTKGHEPIADGMLAAKLKITLTRKMTRDPNLSDHLRAAFVAYYRSDPEKSAKELYEMIHPVNPPSGNEILRVLFMAREFKEKSAIILSCLPPALAEEVTDNLFHVVADGIEELSSKYRNPKPKLLHKTICEFLELEVKSQSTESAKALIIEAASVSPENFANQLEEFYFPKIDLKSKP